MLDFELGPIRPPSERRSLPVRVTRNCPWNRCKFCPFFKGQKFELRSLEEVKQDILTAKAIQDRFLELCPKPEGEDKLREIAIQAFGGTPDQSVCNVANWLYGGGQNAFLQDANTLIIPVNNLVQVIGFLKETLPGIQRVTTYSRSKTAAKRKIEDLAQLKEAGLSRIHIGLETGYDPLLAFMEKGATAADHIQGGQNVVASGISLCVYVILGLGGIKMWREHAIETSRVINEINPEYIRLRTLVVTANLLLYRELHSGNFIRLTDEQIIEEEKLFIQNLNCQSNLVSDSITNLLHEIEGKLPEDKERLLGIIDRFQSLSPIERDIFKAGRRLGIYSYVDDLNDPGQSELVERIMTQHGWNGKRRFDEKVIYTLMERFIQWKP